MVVGTEDIFDILNLGSVRTESTLEFDKCGSKSYSRWCCDENKCATLIMRQGTPPMSRCQKHKRAFERMPSDTFIAPGPPEGCLAALDALGVSVVLHMFN